MLYKIATKDQWNDLQTSGAFPENAFDKESGFIHLSNRDQVSNVLNKRYADDVKKLLNDDPTNLVVFEVYTDKLDAPLKYEPNSKGELFPHLYGKILKQHTGQKVDPLLFLR